MSLIIKAIIGADASGFQAAISKAQFSVDKFGASLTGNLKGKLAGMFGLAAIEAGMRAAVEFGGKLTDLSSKTEISTDTLQAYNYAATQTGSSMEEVAHAMKKLGVAMFDARKGNKDTIEDFQRLGISVSNIKEMSPEAVFQAIAKRVQEVGITTEETASLLKVMGKNADNLIPAMKEGIGDLADEFGKLGLAIDKGTVAKLDEIGDAFDRLKLRGKSFFATAAVETWRLGEVAWDAAKNINRMADGWVSAMSQPITSLFRNTPTSDEAADIFLQTPKFSAGIAEGEAGIAARTKLLRRRLQRNRERENPPIDEEQRKKDEAASKELLKVHEDAVELAMKHLSITAQRVEKMREIKRLMISAEQEDGGTLQEKAAAAKKRMEAFDMALRLRKDMNTPLNMNLTDRQRAGAFSGQPDNRDLIRANMDLARAMRELAYGLRPVTGNMLDSYAH